MDYYNSYVEYAKSRGEFVCNLANFSKRFRIVSKDNKRFFRRTEKGAKTQVVRGIKLFTDTRGF
jgi:hypothetical protein